ncbi:MAG TPA: hypothetical protein VHY35_01015 [Stellaceae bacterium]|jgi:hypothetical protein|nr:hypothetical protein [Stellaceae bacterium]
MGEANRRIKARQKFLQNHKACVYCGESATTTDHCPPRCFFDRREWPETYEFPACESCNRSSRLDEQVLAVLARLQFAEEDKANEREWKSLFSGVVNNQPEYVVEWQQTTATQRKRHFRQLFGSEDGAVLRQAGWGALYIGPLTKSAISRFAVKLGKALYYYHLGNIFVGDMYVRQLNPFSTQYASGSLDKIFELAPKFALLQRNSKPVTHRFNYRYDYADGIGLLYAIVCFGTQMVLQIIAAQKDVAAGIDLAIGTKNRAYRCELGREPVPIV